MVGGSPECTSPLRQRDFLSARQLDHHHAKDRLQLQLGFLKDSLELPACGTQHLLADITPSDWLALVLARQSQPNELLSHLIECAVALCRVGVTIVVGRDAAALSRGFFGGRGFG